jgi:putative heme iron utilization protein
VSSRAREIIEAAGVGSLGTLTDEGTPFVSLVTVAASTPNTIVMLLSGLAKHTKNLDRRGDCSLLLVEPGGESGDPLAGARVTIVGMAKRLDRASNNDVRAIFLEKHPSASMYADFGDFAFFQIDVTDAHLVAGFGRIETIPASDL